MSVLEVYDLESFSNFFSYTGYIKQTDTYHQFVIHKSKNQYLELIKWLSRKIYHVGFNNESYDYPLLHHLINHYEEYKDLDGSSLSRRIYMKSQSLIDMDFSTVADKNKFIPQLDLVKIWHYDNPAKRCSLKHLEIALRMENVEDLPYHHSHEINTEEEIANILSYNKHDVRATYLFYLITIGETDNPLYKGENKLQLRKDFKNKYNLNCLNYSDIKIGEELILKLYCQETKLDPFEVRKLRSPRSSISLNECIFEYIKFQTEPFKQLLNWLKGKIIYETKGGLSEIKASDLGDLINYVHKDSIVLKKDKKTYTNQITNLNLKLQDIQLDYGTGGLHSSNKGIFLSNDEYIILDIDVASMYPSIIVQNELYPEHLGKEFHKVFDKNIVSVRLEEKAKPKELRENTVIKGMKLCANGVYGKSNESSSFLYDPKFTITTTINGQLLLSMLIESILINIQSATFIQVNTDGLSIRLLRSEYDKCIEICKEWENKTRLTLEYVNYKAMYILDVSNYMAVYENNEIKLKSCFEINKDLNKNPSMRIVPIAVKEYFINGTPVEETIKNHDNIYDFCMMIRCNKNYNLIYSIIEDFKIKNVTASKTQRYYASKNGIRLFKKNINREDKNFGKLTGVNVGQNVTLFNKYEEKEMKEYDIDYRFYMNECYKIIQQIAINNQRTLFDE